MAKERPPVTFVERVVGIVLKATLILIGFVIVIIVLALIFGDDDNQETAEAQPTKLVPAPAATADRARSEEPEPPEPEPVAAELNPEPPVPEPELSDASKAIRALFVDLYGFRNHLSFQRKGFAGGIRFQEWEDRLDALVSNTSPDESATTMQQIGYVAGELLTLATTYIDHGGCTNDSLTREMEARLLTESGIEPNDCRGIVPDTSPAKQPEPEPAEQPARTVPQGHPIITRDGYLEQKNDSCVLIAGNDNDDLRSARMFCRAFDSGMIEGLTARGPLLGIWVGPALATDMMVDPDRTKRIVLGMMDSWKTLSGSPSVVVTIHWEDVEIAKGDTTVFNGDVVTVRE